jgi:tyrosyl-tRNA synthetase
MFGKTMSVPDELIMPYYRLCTEIPNSELTKIEQQLADGVNPRDVKCQLAKEIVKLYHSDTDANEAEKEFERIFRSHEAPCDMPAYHPTEWGDKIWLPKLMVDAGLTSSNGEGRRLITQGAVRIDGDKITDPHMEIQLDQPFVLQAGKRRFVQICPK